MRIGLKRPAPLGPFAVCILRAHLFLDSLSKILFGEGSARLGCAMGVVSDLGPLSLFFYI